MSTPGLIYFDGKLIPSADARLHVSSVAVKYGSNVFEGLCTYRGVSGGSTVFRMHEHLQRLQESARMMQIDCDYSQDELADAVLSTVRGNNIEGDSHIRLSIFVVGDGFSETTGPASLVCIATPRGAKNLEERVKHASVSSWLRLDDRVAPPRIKAGANYHNSRFGVLEARRNGYDEALFLTFNGKVSEGGNSCFFMVKDGVLVTPPVTASILISITRQTLIELARDQGIEVQEREIDRSELYIADEAFLCGSGLEISPILSVDRFPVGDRSVGPVTHRLWDAYDSVIRGGDARYQRWLTPVYGQGQA
ncbi:MAG: branched-chain amino acid transaminase [Candidimonas sp.]